MRPKEEENEQNKEEESSKKEEPKNDGVVSVIVYCAYPCFGSAEFCIS